jgi:tRNA threonylcarbamoyladenosine biosynthesis protein TsaE
MSTLVSNSPEETHRLGVVLGQLLEPGHVVGLVGELGAGKTCLAAGAAEGLEVDPSIYVSSPSFTLVNEYPGRIPLVHIDFYRLNDPADLAEVGVEAYYREEVACLVEWFDRFPEAAPPEHLQVTLVVTGPASRVLRLAPRGERHAELASRWGQSDPGQGQGKLDRDVDSQLGSGI